MYLMLHLMYLMLHLMYLPYVGSTNRHVLICEVLFGHLVDVPLHSSLCILLCLLLLNFVLGELNSIEHGVDQVLWSFGSRFLALVGRFCL
jgi:hypothetical protein